MSLFDALEEERLEVVKLLDDARKKDASSPSLLINDKYASSRGSSTSRSSSRAPTSSMILDAGGSATPTRSMVLPMDGPSRPGNVRSTSSTIIPTNRYQGYGLKPVKSTPASSRSKSETRHSDPSDPYQDGSSYYYTSAALRPTISSNSSRDTSVTREKPSRLRFWKSESGAQSKKNNRRTQSTSSPIDMEKLRLSLNAQNLTGSTPSIPLGKPTRPRIDGRSQSYSSMIEPTISYESAVLSPQTSKTQSSSEKPAQVGSAYHSLTSDSSKTAQKGSVPSTSGSRRLVDEDGSSSGSDDDSGSSSDDSDSEVESGDESDIKAVKAKAIQSLLTTSAPVKTEAVRKVKSLLDVDLPPGAVPPPSMAEYAAYKRRIIHPNTAFDNNIPEDTPYTSDTEEIIDARRAAKLPFDISTVHSSSGSKRMIRTMSRGDNIPSLTDPNVKRPKTFVLGTDLSPESSHALEWTIGTVLRDSNVLYVVCAFEDEVVNGTSNVSPQKQEDERMEAMTELTNLISKLLKRTRLQVHVIIEVIHCKSPKHLLTAVIDYVNPTMVVLGSRGRSALKGVLLGSFSNYVVERSSVPVMVARRKLQKTKHKDTAVRLANNLRPPGGLSTAIVD